MLTSQHKRKSKLEFNVFHYLKKGKHFSVTPTDLYELPRACLPAWIYELNIYDL